MTTAAAFERQEIHEYFPVKLTETKILPQKKMAQITVIRKGFGNPRDKRYYTSKCMRESASQFVGKKMYIDHDTPKAMRERGGLPRSVRELAGVIKESWYDAAEDAIKANVKIVRDWFWELVSNDPTAVGVSIDAYGKAYDGMAEGKKAKIVEGFYVVGSADWVTEPGAGGKIDKLLESQMEADLMALENMTMEDLVKHRPDLVESIKESASGSGENSGVSAEAIQEAVTKAVAEATGEIEKRYAKDLRMVEARNFVRDYLSNSGLAAPSQARIAEEFHDRDFEDMKDGDKVITARESMKSALDEAIRLKREEISAYAPKFGVRGMGPGMSFQEGNSNDGGEGGNKKVVSLREAAPLHAQWMEEIGIPLDDDGNIKDGK